MAKLDTIDIDGHAIVVAPEEEAVLIRPICERIGLDADAQIKRLKRQAWACTSIMDVHDPLGRLQQQIVLPRAQVPMWLATIDANRIKRDDARQVLQLFQRRCAEVLESYWMGDGRQSTPDADLTSLEGARAADRLRLLANDNYTQQATTHEEHRVALRQLAYRTGLVTSPIPPAIERQPTLFDIFERTNR